MARQMVKRAAALLLLGSLVLLFWDGIPHWQASSADVSNPRGNFWRVVREGIPGFMNVVSSGHEVLIQNGGENWREIRNGVLMRGSQVLIIAALLGMGLFYRLAGKDRLGKPRSGVRIERFSLRERILHWYTAVLFVVMALTGLGILLGRLLFIPIVGHGFVSGLLTLAKVLHNYAGPLLLIGIVLQFVIWVPQNIPSRMDLQWFKTMGGVLGHGPRPHSGKINGGEKAWFWAVFVFSIAVGITGILLDFPIWGQTRATMQVAHVVHATMAVLFVTVSFGHIYMGTLGAEGTFEGMWTGSVDAVWAEQHQDLWYEEKMREAEEKKMGSTQGPLSTSRP